MSTDRYKEFLKKLREEKEIIPDRIECPHCKEKYLYKDMFYNFCVDEINKCPKCGEHFLIKLYKVERYYETRKFFRATKEE